MRVWIETWRVVPPPNVTMSGCFGGSYMFVAYSPWLDQWYWIQPGGIEEKIPEPEKIFVDEAWARDHPRVGFRREKASLIRKPKGEQLLLF